MSITRGDNSMIIDMLAMHKATTISISHKGIISSVALCQKPLILISKYWNGGHLDYWIQILKSNGSKPMLVDFVDTINTPQLFIENIMYVRAMPMQVIPIFLGFNHCHPFQDKYSHDLSITGLGFHDYLPRSSISILSRLGYSLR